MSDAEKCRQRGWGVGDVLEGTESGLNWSMTNRIVITAIGEESILARCVAHIDKYGTVTAKNCRESNWTLSARDWRKVTPEPSPPSVSHGPASSSP